MPAHMGAILWQFHRAAAGLAYMYDFWEVQHPPNKHVPQYPGTEKTRRWGLG